ncbi:MAG: glycosyltransferase [Xanthobacteraceae bacterium]
MKPVVSVIIPTQARPRMLSEALKSVRAQTFKDFEIIVVINGADNPHTLQSKLEAAGCNLIRVQQGSIAVALNAGIRTAQGEWLAFLDDDDLWEPNWIEVALKAADASEADVIFSDAILFDEHGGTPNAPRRPPSGLSAKAAMTLKNYAGGCSTTIAKRAAVMAIGGFDPTFVSPDWDLWMRLAWSYRVAWVDAHLVWVRVHSQNTSKRISWARTTLHIQSKAIKNLPNDLRYIRFPLLLEMIKVAMKGAETYVRRNWLHRLKRKKSARKGELKYPPGLGTDKR